MTTSRRLAAILAADVAGYSAAMERDEEGTAAAVRALRHDVIEPKLAEHQGRLIKTTGDGFLAEFASPIAALKCALAIQQRPDESDGLRLRVGLNLGDVIIEAGGDVLGEGVNIAARLEALAEPGGILISGKVHSEVEGKVGAAFEDRGEQLVKNISKPVRAYAVRTSPGMSGLGPTQDVEPMPLPDKPSIAVLPFQNMSGDPDQEYFADGIVEEIITALSRFHQLFVIARNSSFTYKGKPIDVKQVGRELGVRYVLEGSVRKAGGRVRITGQLIEAATGAHLWADRFDGELADVFELQDQITASVVGAAVPKLEQAETDRAKRKSTQVLGSHDCLLRGMSLHYAGAVPEALSMFKQAIALDPENAAAYAMAAFSTMGPSPEARAEAVRLANHVTKLRSDDAFALARAAQVLAFAGHEYERAEEIVEHSVALNSNLAMAWFCRGWISMNCGEWGRALDSFERGLRLSPLDPLRKGSIEYGKACAYHGLARFAEGCSAATRAIQARPWAGPLGAFIMNAVGAGRISEARETMSELMKLRPDFTVSDVRRIFQTRDEECMARMVSAFHEAGLPK
jgi:adenylate cyclase